METQVCMDWTEMSEIELHFKNKVNASRRPAASCSREAHRLLMTVWNRDTLELREDFIVLFLNTRSRVLGFLRLAVGAIDGVVVDRRLIMATALKVAASGIILAHNHPSGDLSPSKADRETTKKIQEAAALLDIVLQDHIIVGPDGDDYRSMADNAELL